MAMTFADLVARNAALSGEVQRSHEALKVAQLTIDKMKVELAYLRRMKYGRSSERLEHPQLELVGGQVVEPVVEPAADAGADDGLKSNVTSLENERKKREPKTRPGLRELPAHLPRRTVVHTQQASCGCKACGGALREIGQDVSEVLDYEPGTFHVVRHVRPKLACAGCKTITQALAPTRPVDRCMAGAGLLAHIVVSKFADHVPLYRLCQIYGRDGVELSRSTITDMVGNCGVLLTPLAEAVGRHVLKAHKVHGDDTPIRALSGKGKKAHQGRLWVYVRDDRPSGDKAPPAVWFQYSPDRKGEHPARHLKNFSGVLQADAYSGYDAIYKKGRILEAGCWSHYPERCFMSSMGPSVAANETQDTCVALRINPTRATNRRIRVHVADVYRPYGHWLRQLTAHRTSADGSGDPAGVACRSQHQRHRRAALSAMD